MRWGHFLSSFRSLALLVLDFMLISCWCCKTRCYPKSNDRLRIHGLTSSLATPPETPSMSPWHPSLLDQPQTPPTTTTIWPTVTTTTTHPQFPTATTEPSSMGQELHLRLLPPTQLQPIWRGRRTTTLSTQTTKALAERHPLCKGVSDFSENTEFQVEAGTEQVWFQFDRLTFAGLPVRWSWWKRRGPTFPTTSLHRPSDNSILKSTTHEPAKSPSKDLNWLVNDIKIMKISQTESPDPGYLILYSFKA